MKVFISVDIEGISGVVHADMMAPRQPEYDRGRALMIADANAAIEGAVQAGAEYILVADGHGPMRNLKIEHLHGAAHLVTGTADARDLCMIEGANTAEFDAALLIGYHSMAKTLRAIHPHTFVGVAVHELRVNGRPHGECGMNALALASLGIPTVMLTGDESTCAEARAFLGGSIQTVAVKSAFGRNAALCRPPAQTAPEITAAAKLALENRASVPLYQAEGPLDIEIDFVTMMQCDRARRIAGVERINGVTVKIHGETPLDQYRAIWAALRAAVYEPAPLLA